MEPQAEERSGEALDQKRRENVAYEYLCHLEEAKSWIQACIREELPPTTELEESLRNGVYLARLGHFFAPEAVSLNRIFDKDLVRYRSSGLNFRHIDNINYFLHAMNAVKFPSIFYPETTDVYERKNIPRLVYCIHALSLYLFRLGKAPQIQDLYGKAKFTNEEISAMSEELKKYGMSIPQFQKIGGLLATELPVDEATLHASILAINETLQNEDKSEEEVLESLLNPAAHLTGIESSLAGSYVAILQDALELKAEAALNRSLSDSYVADVYDEILTQAEIQGHINSVNTSACLCRIENILKRKDQSDLFANLKSPALGLKSLSENNKDFYSEELAATLLVNNNFNLTPASLQNCVQVANKKAAVIKRLNESLVSSGNLSDTLNALWDLARLDPAVEIIDQVAALYRTDMAEIREDLGRDLSYSAVVNGLKTLTQMAKINMAIAGSDEVHFLELVNGKHAYLEGVKNDFASDYMLAMYSARQKKIEAIDPCPFLRHFDVQEIIEDVNAMQEESQKRLSVLQELNLAVDSRDTQRLEKLLTCGNFDIWSAKDDVPLYENLFQRFLSMKRELASRKPEKLMADDVRQLAGAAESILEDFRKVFDFHSRLHHCVITRDHRLLGTTLKERWSAPDKVAEEVAMTLLRDRSLTSTKLSYETAAEVTVWFNVVDGSYTWTKPKPSAEYSNVADIESLVNKTVAVRCPKFVGAVVKLQRLWRGRRKPLPKHDDELSRQVAAIKIQSWWRGVRASRLYRKYKELKDREERLQLELKDPLARYRGNIESIVRIQRAWRRHRARNDMKLLKEGTPSIPTLRRFLHLLSLDRRDFDAETQLQNMKAEVVKAIRVNEQLEKDLATMDVKIGLLIRNQISLQEVLAHGNKVNRQIKPNQTGVLDSHLQSAVTLLCHTKAGKEQLQQYEQLFYMLQTQPRYLAKLLFLLPPNKSSRFLEETVLSIFNYGADTREEYLLLKLFETALEEEVFSKIDKIIDFATATPLVIRLVVKYSRKGHGLAQLREFLGPLIQSIIDDKTPVINTNPVELYKNWVSQTEYKTGQPMGLPYQVTQDQALKHQEVQKQLSSSIQKLRNETVRFVKKITEAPDNLPYGILYMAKVLHRSLEKKFKGTPEKDILKVVGNLLYYQYINPAIVAPDAFDIVQLLPDQLLDMQRRNLGNIAKMLQFASTKKGFGEESPHLIGLNPFIIECHEVFKLFFRRCCQVETLEEHFGIDRYTEATLLSAPQITLDLQELLEVHQLLHDHAESIAPQPTEPLRALLRELGPRPEIVDFLTDSASHDPTDYFRTEIPLSLKPDCSLEDGDLSSLEIERLFLRTKQLLVCVLPCTSGTLLARALRCPATELELQEYGRRVVDLQEKNGRSKQLNAGMARFNSFLDEFGLPLDKLKERIYRNLKKLEIAGRISRDDGFAAILESLARDILGLGKQRRSRLIELERLRIAKERLGVKTRIIQDQAAYYNQYMQACLSGLAPPTKKKKGVFQMALKNNRSLKYSATKLQEKGVLISIKGLEPHHIKSVIFEIKPSEKHAEKFKISAIFLGVNVEEIEMDIQELLQLQYEGATVMNIFGKAAINVNLLLHLLFSKFYTKK